MKSSFLFLSLTLGVFITGCKNEQPAPSDTITTNTEVPDPAHNSQNSLDWAGTYVGTTPCHEPCQGEKTIMQINSDSTYTLSVQAIGQEDVPRLFSGTFHWDTNKNVITLDENGDHHKFQVREGALKELDKFGDPKQLGNQEDYILKKQ